MKKGRTQLDCCYRVSGENEGGAVTNCGARPPTTAAAGNTIAGIRSCSNAGAGTEAGAGGGAVVRCWEGECRDGGGHTGEEEGGNPELIGRGKAT